MCSKGFGFKHWSAIKQNAFNLICFSFLDDTNLLNTFKPGNYSIEELIISTQNTLNYWQGGIQATGGKLVPEKSY